MRKRILILSLVVLLLVIGAFAYNKFKPLKPIQNSIINPQSIKDKAQEEAKRKQEEENAKSAAFRKELKPKAVEKDVLEINNCQPTPQSMSLLQGKPLVIKNTGSSDITVEIEQYPKKLEIKAGESLTHQFEIARSGYLYSCRSADKNIPYAGVVFIRSK